MLNERHITLNITERDMLNDEAQHQWGRLQRREMFEEMRAYRRPLLDWLGRGLGLVSLCLEA